MLGASGGSQFRPEKVLYLDFSGDERCKLGVLIGSWAEFLGGTSQVE